jgi:DNA-binding NtrC family response regulator
MSAALVVLGGDMARVLVVDDDVRVTVALRRVLRRRGFDVHTTTSPHEALAIVEALAPDVVVSDFAMPEMNGRALLAEIERRAPNASRILLSAHADLDPANLTLRGIRFLSKPWDDDELVHACTAGKE